MLPENYRGHGRQPWLKHGQCDVALEELKVGEIHKALLRSRLQPLGVVSLCVSLPLK